MSDEKRIVVYNKIDGTVSKVLPYTEENIVIDITSDETITVVPKEVLLTNSVDEKQTTNKVSLPENVITNKNKSHNIPLSGPSRYTSQQRLPSTSVSLGKLILGGQHTFATNLSGTFFNTGQYTRYVFDNKSSLDDLKLLPGDHFQILNTLNTTLDGIYQVRGFFSESINTLKVSGVTSGLSGGFNVSSGTTHPDGFHMIRLQEVAGVSFGLSADVDGCGVYQFGEGIEQSVYKPINTGNVTHSTDRRAGNGSASMDFPGAGSGSTGPLITLDSNTGFTFDNSSKYYFRLSTWIKHDTAAPSADAVIVGKREKSGLNGAYFLKYETTPKSYVFAFSTNASGSDFNRTLSASIPLISLTGFHHVQVDIGDVEARMYVNGQLFDTEALGTTEEIFQDDTAPFIIGAESDGSSPITGNIDEVNLIFAKATESGATAILATNLDAQGTTGAGATLGTGITIDLPTVGSTGSAHTKLLFKGDGIAGCQRFVENGLNVAEAQVQSYDADRRIMFITNYGYTGSSEGFNTTQGYVKGQDLGNTGDTAGVTGNSQAVYPLLDAIIGITNTGLSVGTYQDILNEEQTLGLIRDLTTNAMSGDSGDFGNFTNLFTQGGGCFGAAKDSLTFFATEGNTNRVTEYERLVGLCGGLSGSLYYFLDGTGVSFGVYGYELDDFLTDITIYRNTKQEGRYAATDEINSKTNFESLKIEGKSKSLTKIQTAPFPTSSEEFTPSADTSSGGKYGSGA